MPQSTDFHLRGPEPHERDVDRPSKQKRVSVNRQSLVQGLTTCMLVALALSATNYSAISRTRGCHHEIPGDHYDGDNLLGLPLCSRLLLHAPRGSNGFGSQIIRHLAGFLAAEGMNATWYWFPGAPWNYQCQIGMNWNCYFENARDHCRYENDGHWKAAQISDVVEKFLASGQQCKPLSAVEKYSDKMPLLANKTRIMWAETPDYTGIGPIQCRSHTRSEDSDACLAYMESKFNELPTSEALVRHRQDMRLMWRLKPEVIAYVNDHQAKLKLNRASVPLATNSNYMSLHLRRGDKDNEVPHMPMNYYVEAVRFGSEKTGLRQLFVASDDGDAVIELAVALKPLSIRVVALDSAIRRAGHQQRDFNLAANTGDLVPDLITELEIMAHGSYFIGTSSSAISRVVHMLRPAHEPANSSIFLDRVWGCALWWQRFPRYCDSRLAPEVSGANQDFCGKYREMLSQVDVHVNHFKPVSIVAEQEIMQAAHPDNHEGLGYLVDVTRRTFPFVANIACEQQPLELNCLRDSNVLGTRIRVMSATFGRSKRGWPECVGQKEPWIADTNCGAAGNAERDVKAECEGKSICKLLVPELEIDVGSEELCVADRKYLNVSYECV